MFRKIVLLTCSLAMTAGMTWSVCAQEASETISEESIAQDEAADSSDAELQDGILPEEESVLRLWQGYMNGSSYTFRIDPEEGTACIAKTAEDGTAEIISGACAVDESGLLTVTGEDGTIQSWTASAVSSCAITASGEDGEITLVRADPNLAELINDYAWYAGLSEEGDAYTYGIALDCSKLIFGFYTEEDETLYETELSLTQTGGGDGTISGTAVDDEGTQYTFSYSLIEDNPVHASITLNGETCEVSAIEARVFSQYVEPAE